MRDLFSVKDKVVVITGGTGGIGSALVKGFNEAGAIVYSTGRSYVKDKNKFQKQLDLTSIKSIVETMHDIMTDNCKIDVLINCAGITLPNDFAGFYLSKYWSKTIDSNLTSVFNMCQCVGLHMLESKTKGSIINFTSIGAVQAMPNNPAYAAAKAGVMQLTKAFALDWGKHGVRVNNIGPGYTETKMNKISLADPEEYKLRADNSMLGRWAKPEEMVGPAIFLASDASSFITGSDLWVDGGWLSKGM